MGNKFHENYKNQVLHLADEMRTQPMPELTEELFAWTMAVVIFSLLLQKLMHCLLRGREGHA